MKTLENRFESDLINKMNIAKKQCKYNPTRFLQTLYEMGGVATEIHYKAQAIIARKSH